MSGIGTGRVGFGGGVKVGIGVQGRGRGEIAKELEVWVKCGHRGW